MMWDSQKYSNLLYGWQLDKTEAVQTKDLVTTLNGYYAPSRFVCTKLKPLRSFKPESESTGFWICETRLVNGSPAAVVIKLWRDGVDYDMIRNILRDGPAGLVQMVEVSSHELGPMDTGLCTVNYLMNLWEFCNPDNNVASSLPLLLRAGADLIRGVTSFHSFRDKNNYALIHLAIRPQHFLCNTFGQWFLTGFDEMQPTCTSQDTLRQLTLNGSATRYPVSCSPETLCLHAFKTLDHQDPGLGTPDGRLLISKYGALAMQAITPAYDLFGLGYCLLLLLHTPSNQQWPFCQTMSNELRALIPFQAGNHGFGFRQLKRLLSSQVFRSSLMEEPSSTLPGDIIEVIKQLMSLNESDRTPAALALNAFEARIRAMDAAHGSQMGPAIFNPALPITPEVFSAGQPMLHGNALQLSTRLTSLKEASKTGKPHKSAPASQPKKKRASAAHAEGTVSVKVETPRVTRSQRKALGQLEPNNGLPQQE